MSQLANIPLTPFIKSVLREKCRLTYCGYRLEWKITIRAVTTHVVYGFNYIQRITDCTDVKTINPGVRHLWQPRCLRVVLNYLSGGLFLWCCVKPNNWEEANVANDIVDNILKVVQISAVGRKMWNYKFVEWNSKFMLRYLLSFDSTWIHLNISVPLQADFRWALNDLKVLCPRIKLIKIGEEIACSITNLSNVGFNTSWLSMLIKVYNWLWWLMVMNGLNYNFNVDYNHYRPF